MVRDNVTALVRGAAMVPNNVLRVMSDAMAGLARLVLEYLDWLAKQLLPDTAETEWLDRHGQIWLRNADGTKGRKAATLSVGTVNLTGTTNAIVPAGSVLAYAITGGGPIQYETTQEVILGFGATAVPVRALVGGAAGNLDPGTQITFVTAVPGVSGGATVVSLIGGTDQETDDDLRTRVLLRIQQPPMGGDATDYIEWALAVPGVTRAWSFPLEMGIGTVTLRFMCDALRASNNGFPSPVDIDAVRAYIDTVRPVAVKDLFIVAPQPFPVNMTISNLSPDTTTVRAAIAASLDRIFLARSKPGQTWYRAWSDEGIANAAGVAHYDLALNDAVMPNNGFMPSRGDIIYAAG